MNRDELESLSKVTAIKEIATEKVLQALRQSMLNHFDCQISAFDVILLMKQTLYYEGAN